MPMHTLPYSAGAHFYRAFILVAVRRVRVCVHVWVLAVVLTGDTAVGKSMLIHRFVKRDFMLASSMTIGVEVSSKAVTVGKTEVEALIWDTAGMERFKSLTTAFYRGAAGALLVYDITSRPSFDNIKRWLKQLRHHALPEVVVLLVGNKSDLRRHRAVRVEEGLALAESCNMGFIETSALDSTGVENAFTTVVEEILAIRERAGAPLKPLRKGLRPASAAGGSKTTRTAASSTRRPPLGGDSIRVARWRNDDDGEDTHAALCCT